MREAIRERFGMGTGSKKINGKASRVFLKPEETDQEDILKRSMEKFLEIFNLIYYQ